MRLNISKYLNNFNNIYAKVCSKSVVLNHYLNPDEVKLHIHQSEMTWPYAILPWNNLKQWPRAGEVGPGRSFLVGCSSRIKIFLTTNFMHIEFVLLNIHLILWSYTGSSQFCFVGSFFIKCYQLKYMEFMAWMNNYTQTKIFDVITNPYPEFNGGSAKPIPI